MAAKGKERALLAAIREIAESRKLAEMVKLDREAVSDTEKVEQMHAPNSAELGELTELFERYALNPWRRHAR